jgi:predicted neuraminidase
MLTHRFLYEYLPNAPSCHAGTLAQAESGDFLAAFYAGTREGHTDVGIYLARMRDGRDTWEDVHVLVDTPGKSEGNPVLFVDGFGHVWMFYVTQQAPGWDYVLMYATKSEDEGRTWDEPRLLSPNQGWMTKNKPARLSSGRIILPCYDEVKWRSFCLLSDDECQTWQTSGPMEGPVDVIQPSILERPDGSLLALMRSGPDRDRPDMRRIFRTVSLDAGQTWSPCEPTDLPNPNSGTDAVMLSDGRAVLAYNPTPDGRTPLSVALSTDGGETWPHRRDLETDPGEYSYPAIIEDAAGLVHVHTLGAAPT